MILAADKRHIMNLDKQMHSCDVPPRILIRPAVLSLTLSFVSNRSSNCPCMVSYILKCPTTRSFMWASAWILMGHIQTVTVIGDRRKLDPCQVDQVVYCVAFAVELWWIVESLLILPAPAYTLCALYLFNFMIAAVLLFGLLIRQRKYLMSWTLMTVLSFFPEAGMVLFMSLYYWPTHKFEYGVIELVYWALRSIFNIFGALCVCSLYLTWRDEEMILGRLHDLTLANVESGCNGLGITRHGNGTLKRAGNLAYQNYAYTDSNPVLTDHPLKSSTLHRGRYGGGSNGNFSVQSRGSFTLKSEFSPAYMFDPMYKKSRISELGIAGIGLEPPGMPGTLPIQRSHSLWNVNNDDYWNRPPPSRPVSMGYVNHVLHYDKKDNNNTLSLDRRKNWMVNSLGGRRAASMDGLNTWYRYYGHNIVGSHPHYHPSHWSKSSLGQESDDIHHYRDIAL